MENALLGASRLAKTFSTLAQKVLKSDFGINIVFCCFKILYKTIIVPLIVEYLISFQKFKLTFSFKLFL